MLPLWLHLKLKHTHVVTNLQITGYPSLPAQAAANVRPSSEKRIQKHPVSPARRENRCLFGIRQTCMTKQNHYLHNLHNISNKCKTIVPDHMFIYLWDSTWDEIRSRFACFYSGPYSFTNGKRTYINLRAGSPRLYKTDPIMQYNLNHSSFSPYTKKSVVEGGNTQASPRPASNPSNTKLRGKQYKQAPMD